MLETIFKIRLVLGAFALIVLVAGRVLGFGPLAFGSDYQAEPLRLPPLPTAAPLPAAAEGFISRVGRYRVAAKIDGVEHFRVDFYRSRVTITLKGTGARVSYDRGSSRLLQFSAVRGTVRLRAPQGTWIAVPTGVRSGNPFGNPARIEVQYKGRSTINGKKLHHLVIANQRSLVAAIGAGEEFTQVVPETSSFHVYVNDKGTPVVATVNFKGTAAFYATPVVLNLQLRYTFTTVRST